MESTKIGVVGCGNISGIYFQNLCKYRATEVLACADLDLSKAKASASKYGIPRACTVEQLLAMDEVEIVLDLTVPKAHAQVGQAALAAGKHVYSEKPLAVVREDARKTLDLATEKGLRVGCAPDTFLGAGIQTCRGLIDAGVIGEPVAAQAFMLCPGHESWHPAPEFYYETGGGPMLDMGPYYLTALINLLGPVRRVTGSTRASFATRTITSEPKKGKVVQVETPTHISGTLDFESGAIGTITTSFDVHGYPLPSIIVFGAEGTLEVPDPNTFGGKVKLRKKTGQVFDEVPLTHRYEENSRGLGVMDMGYAIKNGRPHRASGALAYHVLDAMLAFIDASESGRHVELTSGVERPAPMPKNPPADDLDG